ncbi:MAG: sugar phosphate isomerase/epimerase, partial [Clostridia bacterium]|nr:sugar phosphate isomerase/epimerase [Clostridia bacterium]
MKIGISTASLFMRLYNEDAIALISEWGVQTAEVFYTSFSEYEPRFSETLLKRKGRLHVNSVHVLNTQFEPQLFSAHPRVRADAYGMLEKVMKSARIIGAENYTFHGLARLKSTFKEDLKKSGEKLAEISDFCKARGVRLCLENVEWALFNRPEVFKVLKDYCPELKSVLDIKQAAISGYPYEEYLKAMGERLAYVHVSDMDENGKKCLPCRGVFNFDELFRRLAGVGFDGAVIIENYNEDY